MAFKLPAGSTTEYPRPSKGTKAARCIRVVDTGTHMSSFGKPSRKCMLTWEVDEMMEDGKPFVVQQDYTASFADTAHLGKAISSWFNKEFTEEEKMEFDLFSLVGETCLVTISESEGKNGKIYQNIKTVTEKPDAYPIFDQVNESFVFSIDEDLSNTDKLKKLWGLERYKIKLSDEFKAAGITMPEYEKKEEKSAAKDDGGSEVPFD